MTLTTIDPDIRAWLYTKGFQNDDDIITLERLGGTLTRGLSMLLHALPRCPKQHREYSHPTRSYCDKEEIGFLDKNKMSQVKALYESLVSSSVSHRDFSEDRAGSPVVITSEFSSHRLSNTMDEEHQLEPSITNQEIKEFIGQEEDIEPETLTQVILDEKETYHLIYQSGNRGDPRRPEIRAQDQSLKRLSRTSMKN
ncbi:hypothetical protein FE257_006475 [Aspergillus nanangensis]|uniref:Uncharacterized protein n=1 Tax=Aspergillus nanangensis TaxID=2582783 RepID=A0AAD4CZI0_ASPNN|nr:hypothetical protein FE257_006475 [Aspergillus nanangensis]